MSNWLTLFGAVGVASSLAALLALGAGLAREGRWGAALTCLGAISVILLLLLSGIHYADNFWEGRS